MLRAALLIAAYLTLLSWATLAADPAPPKAIQGTWEGFVVDGKGDRPNSGVMHIRLEIQGNRMTGTDLREKKALGEGTFQIRPDRRELDATGNVIGAGNNRTYLGIYTLEGDTLRWCVNNFNVKTRPTDLETKKAQFLMILKRTKP